MIISTILYVGLFIMGAGVFHFLAPRRWLKLGPRRKSLYAIGTGFALSLAMLLLPPPGTRTTTGDAHIDRVMPHWQFREFHQREIGAPPAVVYDAIKRVRADDIALFNTLIAIRNCGQPMSPAVKSAADRYESIIDVATHSSFTYLAETKPQEFVLGTVVGDPADAPDIATEQLFRGERPPGYALATMNFIVRPAGRGGTVLSTETRVCADPPAARWRFAAYWRLIRPGSGIIRVMFLRAIDRAAIQATSSIVRR